MPSVQKTKEKRTPFQAIREIFSKIPEEIWLYFYDTKLVLGEIDKETGEYKNTQIKYCYLGNIDELPTETKKQVLEIKTKAEIIEDHEFWKYGNLQKVELLDGVLEINPNVFHSCSKLKELKLGKGIKNIPFYCFRKSGLEKLEIPSNIKSIGEFAFDQCSISEVIFEEGLEEIEKYAFDLNEIKQIKIPKSVKKISAKAFGRGIDFSEKQTLKVQILGDGKIEIDGNAFDSNTLVEVTHNKDVRPFYEFPWSYDEKAKFKIIRVENIGEEDKPLGEECTRRIELSKKCFYQLYKVEHTPTVHPQMPNKPNEVDNEKPSNPTNPSNGIGR